MRASTVEERMASGIYEETRARLQEMLSSHEDVPVQDERVQEEGIELSALGSHPVVPVGNHVSTPRRSELEPDAEPLRVDGA
eukprot:6322770-Amphidinium_carterae.1